MKERACEERKGTRVSVKEVEQRLGQGLGEADLARGQGLSAMARIKRAKLVQVRRERGRAEAKYGAKSARVERLDRQLVVEHRLLVDARAERDRSCKQAPVRNPKTFTVYGHVRDADGHAQVGNQVELVVSRDAKNRLLATGKTNDAGYYVLVVGEGGPYERGVGETVGPQKRLIVEGELEGKDEPSVGPYDRAEIAGTLLVTNPAGKLVHRECRSVAVRPGGLVYRELRLKEVTKGGIENHPSRYLGNAKNRELHDVRSEKPQCQLAEIHPAHRVHFTELKTPLKAGYDYCAYCFGKDQSRR